MKYHFIILLLILSIECSELNDTITCINQYIETFKDKMVTLPLFKNPTLFNIFLKAFPNTMSTTIKHYNLSKGN